ncbi:MAG: winged helix-turn-helix domain-containing protein [Pirellulales bacterium]|nr:winged helix-turn-helix domain-containing protein [Pirellulales bacterium]
MAKKPPVPCVTSIGETAGAVWRILSANGPMPIAKLIKGVGEPRDMVVMALGWLARENKINLEDHGRTRVVSLC